MLFSIYEITVNGHYAKVASSGSFWADPATAELLRLSEQADDIPPDLDTLSVTSTIDYSRLLLGSKPFLFPQTAVLTLVRASGAESRNRISPRAASTGRRFPRLSNSRFRPASFSR
jgi:hypothetical protein